MSSTLIVTLKDGLKHREINDIIASIQRLSGVLSVEEEEDDDDNEIVLPVSSMSPDIIAHTRVIPLKM